MADFCFQCTEKHLGIPGEKNDMKGITTPEMEKIKMYCVVLCEGCGPIQVDNAGRCISTDCLERGHKTKGE